MIDSLPPRRTPDRHQEICPVACLADVSLLRESVDPGAATPRGDWNEQANGQTCTGARGMGRVVDRADARGGPCRLVGWLQPGRVLGSGRFWQAEDHGAGK